ncbi:MAG: hypothetical protein K8L99_02005 [Anaerolineae bacterium]|nr:hypothetical protein [Anaerolineae bacterium]
MFESRVTLNNSDRVKSRSIYARISSSPTRFSSVPVPYLLGVATLRASLVVGAAVDAVNNATEAGFRAAYRMPVA